MDKKLTRKINERMVAGVCSGLGDYFNIDPTFVRLFFAICIITPVPIILPYLVMWMVIPEEDFKR